MNAVITRKELMLRTMLKYLLLPIIMLASTAMVHADEPSCDELNRLFLMRYSIDFSVAEDSFEYDPIFGPDKQFDCDTSDKLFVMARAINDLDRLRPVKDGDIDYYEEISRLFQFRGTKLRYFEKYSRDSRAVGYTVNTGQHTDVFLFGRLLRGKSRLRPTAVLVHESRHMIEGKPGYEDEPGHIPCTQGRHRGTKSCDRRLGPEDVLLKGSGNGYEFLFLVFVRDHPEASETIKKEARKQIQYLADNMFNKVDLGMAEYYGFQQ